MPMTADMGKNMEQMKKENMKRSKKRSRKQMIAIALSEARKRGGKA